ncbi:MAG: peptide chain release factor N(5)-glutamine methyltransferase, partial [Bacteroidota bacterium]|nr:peptide chain release factor N(5)-glutamine methyltransferase [Bacteroidota bacterium]
MTHKEFRFFFDKKMTPVYPKAEIDSLFAQLMEFALNISRAEMILKSDQTIENHSLINLLEYITRLEKKEPIQYIIGQVNFAEVPVNVNNNVLIPRPETESLVYWMKEQEQQNPSVLDICTGSGCIAFALEKHLNAKVNAWDVSYKALQLAKQTAKSIGSAVNFSRVDILSTVDTDQKWDIIVSNPPYVLEEESSEIDGNVLHYEPDLALFTAADDSIQFYRAIIQFAAKHL